MDKRSAFISEIRADYFSKGYVKFFSFDLNTNWEKLPPVVEVSLEDREVKLMGYTDDERIRKMAQEFEERLDDGSFEVGFRPNVYSNSMLIRVDKERT